MFIIIATLLSMTIEFSLMIVTHWQWAPEVYVLLSILSIFISMIISALICSRIHNISILNGVIIINNSKKIPIDSIDWYFNDQNFFFDGFRLKTKQKKNYFLTSFNFLKKDPNYTNLKNTLLNKFGEEQIQLKKFS
jgi:hypothetical protein